MKYAFIQRHRHAWPVSGQCRVLQVSAAGYHAHLVRRASDAQQRLSDEALLVHIKALHAETRSAYGWPRIWCELVARGIAVGKARVQSSCNCTVFVLGASGASRSLPTAITSCQLS